MNVKTAANLALQELKDDDANLEISPAFIIILIQVIQALLPILIENCGTPAADVALAANGCLKPRGMMDWFRIVRARRIMIAEVGRRTLMEMGGVDAVMTAVCKAGSKLTEQDADTLYQSIT